MAVAARSPCHGWQRRLSVVQCPCGTPWLRRSNPRAPEPARKIALSYKQGQDDLGHLECDVQCSVPGYDEGSWPPEATPRVLDLGLKKDFDRDFEMGGMLGRGSFAVVRLCTHRATGETFAVKIMTKRCQKGQASLETQFAARVHHEVDMLRTLGRSLNVAYLYGAYEDRCMVYLVLEYCKGGDLGDFMSGGPVPETQARRLIRGVVQAVAQCHAKNILMRDVKPGNFMLLSRDLDSPVKAIDFGIAWYVRPGQRCTDRAGSPAYLAPEVVRESYGIESDLWSAGILAYRMLVGRQPFTGPYAEELASALGEDGKLRGTKELFKAILYADLDFESEPWGELSAEARDFVSRLLVRDPAQRMSALEALSHPWLSRPARPAPGHAGNGDGRAAGLDLDVSIVQRLQCFATFPKIKQEALLRIVQSHASHPAFQTTDLVSLASVPDRVDPSHGGRLTYRDFAHILSGFAVSEEEVRQLLAGVDVLRDGLVDRDEWMAAVVDWKRVQELPEWEGWVREVFAEFNRSQSGLLSSEEVQEVICHDACEAPDDAEGAIREVLEGRDGVIGLGDFVALMRTEGEDFSLFDDRVPYPTLP